QCYRTYRSCLDRDRKIAAEERLNRFHAKMALRYKRMKGRISGRIEERVAFHTTQFKASTIRLATLMGTTVTFKADVMVAAKKTVPPSKKVSTSPQVIASDTTGLEEMMRRAVMTGIRAVIREVEPPPPGQKFAP
ncbi:MAG: hypothetical protein V1679_01960, partial [Candidatus Peregrinibacteria bacterium]